jgi:competence protein ComEA
MKNFTLIIASLVAIFAFSQTTLAASKSSEPRENKVNIQKAQKAQKVNLNKADAKELASSLTGVGMKKAVAIVEYRKIHGGFKSIEELASVKGISVKIIAKNQARILLK